MTGGQQMKKRLIAALIAAAMIISVCCQCAFAFDSKETLQFNKDGKFSIIQFSDTHTTDQPYGEMVALIEKALDTYSPDLAVFTGDNVTGGWYMSTPLSVRNAIDALVSPCEKRGVPFAAVFGNHDWQTICPKAWQIKMYQRYDACMMQKGLRSIHRVGNYYLTIKDSSGDKDIFNLWMMDSGSKNLENDVTGVNTAQIKWYERTSAELARANDGKNLPSILFQHIPVAEVDKLYKQVPEGTDGAIEYNGKSVILDPDKAVQGSGELKAVSGIAKKQNGQYESWVKTGDIIGAFFGHDHVNDFVGKTDDGIILGATKTSGFQSRGDGNQGFRVIVIDESDVSSFDTFSVYYKDLVGGDIPEPKKEYDRNMRWSSILDIFNLF